MYKNSELFRSLSRSDITATLNACGLSEKDQYTDEEGERFKSCRTLIEKGLGYSEAAQLLPKPIKPSSTSAQGDPPSQSTKSDKRKKANKNLSISSLLEAASNSFGVKISLTQALNILHSCGLPDQESYSQKQCAQFLLACDLAFKHGKSYEEISEHFGLRDDDEDLNPDIEKAADALSSQGHNVINSLMEHKAKIDASHAAPLYLQHLANEFGSPEFHEAFQQIESALKAKISGKSPRFTYKPGLNNTSSQKVIQPTTEPLKILPETSDNSSTTE